MAKLRIIFAMLIGALLLGLSFYNNTFSVVDQEKFLTFQLDSESLVISRIVKDEHNLFEESKANLFHPINSNGDLDVLSIYKNYQNRDTELSVRLVPYISQYGLQGDFYSFLSNCFKFDLNTLHLITSLLLSITLICMTMQYIKTIGFPFGLSFFLCVLFSPWLVCFAKNLYWFTFTWFLPSLIALLLFEKKFSSKKLVIFGLLTAAFTIKCLCGYEYISSIILLAAIPFLFKYIYLLFSGEKRVDYLLNFFIICFCGVIGFTIALLLHASIRADSVWDGLVNIYKFDVLRRTYGGEEEFAYHPVLLESLRASLYSVIKTYIFTWYFIPTLPYTSLSHNFVMLSVTGIFSAVLLFVMGCRKYFILIVLFALVPLSWFVLAKAHSYIHTHMNYVLWYFGFIPALISSIFAILAKMTRKIINLNTFHKSKE